MNINRGDDRFLFFNAVLKNGRSLNAGRGNLFAAKLHSANTDGLQIISDFKNLPKNEEIVLRVGAGDDKQDTSTVPFKLEDVIGLEVKAPSTVESVDDFVIGYNGLDEDTAINVIEGEYQNHEIVVSNGLTPYYSGNKDLVFPFKIFRKEGETNQEAVERAVDHLNNIEFGAGNKLSDIVKVSTVNSENEELTSQNADVYKNWTLDLTSYTNLEVQVATDYNAGLEGFIQGQYDFKVKEDGQGVFVAVVPEGITPESLKIKSGNVTQECDCPDGYTTTESGELYSIKVNDTQVNVENALTTASVDFKEMKAMAESETNKTYMFLVDDKFEVADVDLEGAQITYLGNIEEFCTTESEVEFDWIEGEECYASVEEYTITIPHDRCGEKHTGILKATYGESVEEVATAGCQTKYKLEVMTNIVCDECDPAFLEAFKSDAPLPYGEYKWKKENKEYSEDALMGIRITGKRFDSNMPQKFFGKSKFFRDSTTLQINTDVCNEYTFGQEDICAGDTALTVLSTKKTLENMGYDLAHFEKEARRYFQATPADTNALEQYFTGTESLIDLNAQYIVYTLKVRRAVNQGNNIAPKVEVFNYKIPQKIGFQKDVEELLNSIATSNGVSPVKAM